jgi:hypothetical protein
MLFAVAVGGAAFFMTTEPVNAVREQLAEIREGKVDEAYQRFSEGFRAEHSLQDFEALIASHPALKDNTDSTFWQRSVENETATLKGFLLASSGQREMVAYKLVKEGGAWKVAQISFDGDS